jgi:hypothetical protein
VLLCLFWLGRAIAGAAAGLASAFVYAFYEAGAAANGPCPNFETWTLLPTTLMYVFLWRFLRAGRRRQLVWAGACACLAMLFKQTVAIFPVIALPLLWMRGENHRSANVRWSVLWRDLAAAAGGFALPLMLISIYFAALGDLAAMVHRLNPISAAKYAASESLVFTWDMLALFGGSFLWQFKFLLAFAALLGLLPLRRLRREDPEDARVFLGRQFILVWLVGALIAVEAGAKFFPHYFMMLLPPLALAAGVSTMRLALDSRLPKFLGVLLMAALLYGTGRDLRLESRIATQALRDRVQLGRLDWYIGCDNYWLYSAVPRYATWSQELSRVGRCIAARTRPYDPVYVWDYEPGLYWYADRRAPTRHFMYFDVAVELPPHSGRWHSRVNERVRASRAELLDDLARRPPAYIVTLNPYPSYKSNLYYIYKMRAAPPFPELQNYIDAHYRYDPDCSTTFLHALRRVQ